MSLVKRIVGRIKYELQVKPVVAAFKKKADATLLNRDFSIIGSNCLAGFIYQDAGIEYLTPTAGLFFHGPCYISFVKNLQENVLASMVEIKESKYAAANEKRKAGNNYYPIGLLNGSIEVHFLHYPTFDDAVEKWKRRAGRINFDNILLLFSERDCCSQADIRAFDALNLPGKVVFTAKEYPELKNSFQLKKYKNKPEVGGADEIRIDVMRSFDIITWLNKNKNKK